MIIQFGSYNLHFQLAPLYGVSVGYLFYTPHHEPDYNIDEEEEEDYQRHQLMLFIFALIVTVWKS